MDKAMPAEASLGSEFTSDLTITANACAANVVVQDSVPAGAAYVRSEPAATVQGSQLTWALGNMDSGESRTIKVTFRAEREGTITNCATVMADPRTCASTFVGKPSLLIEKTGPATATINSDVTYNIVVRNSGTAVARDVVLTDSVPQGMTGQPVSINLGNMAPGESKPASVTFKAITRGMVCNTASASSSNVPTVSDDACTTILVPGLDVEKKGTKSQILGRNADYQIVVTNIGDTTLNNVSVVDTAPSGTSIVSTDPVADSSSSSKATWSIPSLAPGAKETFNLKLTATVAGTHCNSVTASASGLTDTAEACTEWRGIAAVLLEVVDDPDPLQIGESTTYTIKVTNQGFADIHNVNVVFTADNEARPTASPQGSVSGQNVMFPPVSTIGPKQAVTYTITVQGVSAGDSRNKVSLTCEELQTPVEEEESTTVY